MNTREFLARYAWVYCLVVALFLGAGALVRHSVETVAFLQPLHLGRVIVIDAGHGGEDGGTTGALGTGESGINLAIAKRLDALLQLMGYDTIMTRREDVSLAASGETIRSRKQADLRQRVELVNGQPGALLVSIHQNYFPDPQYSGPQVFYAGEAAPLAAQLQAQLNAAFDCKRAEKKSTGVYVMEHIEHPGILVECGFLSNPAEEQKLRTPEHQKRLACVILASVAVSLHSPA